jgi:hypothetical protein
METIPKYPAIRPGRREPGFPAFFLYLIHRKNSQNHARFFELFLIFFTRPYHRFWGPWDRPRTQSDRFAGPFYSSGCPWERCGGLWDHSAVVWDSFTHLYDLSATLSVVEKSLWDSINSLWDTPATLLAE